MAKNDAVILDGILDDRVLKKLPSDKRDEAFEYFAIEQILKDHNLTKDEILSGSVDGKDDGGIDGFYILVNGHLLTDTETFFWPKANAELEVSIITCKHHETFKQAPLDNLTATLSELFDFGIDRKELKGSYNNEVVKSRDLLKAAYRKLAPKLTSFKITCTYASRGDASEVGESIQSRGNQIKSIAEQSFGDCEVRVEFLGSTQLVELSRKIPNFSLELPFIEVLAKGERYVLLSNISDYKRFITDETGKLRRYLFDSNVRDFMGLNRVNEDIKTTLENGNSPDFWWLNNGVTILATSARVIGKTIHIEDIQIVNGLQTTESIYKYFSSGGKDEQDRSVLVKVIVSREEEIRDSIIRATNNQTNVEVSALHATDKIQRDIEDVLLRSGLYYERRTNHYANEGISHKLIVSPLYLAAGYLALVLKDPLAASLLKSKFMRSESSYERIFSMKAPMEVWPQVGKILKKTDAFLENVRPVGHSSNERFLKRYRYILSYIGVAKLAGRIDFSSPDIINLKLEEYTEALLKDVWVNILSDGRESTAKKSLAFQKIIEFIEKTAEYFNLTGTEAFKGRHKDRYRIARQPLTREFIENVFTHLPDGKWSANIFNDVSSKLQCTRSVVYQAYRILKREQRVVVLGEDLFEKAVQI